MTKSSKSELDAATAACFEQELRDLLRRYGVTLTAEDRCVGYSSDFACVNLAFTYFNADTPSMP